MKVACELKSKIWFSTRGSQSVGVDSVTREEVSLPMGGTLKFSGFFYIFVHLEWRWSAKLLSSAWESSCNSSSLSTVHRSQLFTLLQRSCNSNLATLHRLQQRILQQRSCNSAPATVHPAIAFLQQFSPCTADRLLEFCALRSSAFNLDHTTWQRAFTTGGFPQY